MPSVASCCWLASARLPGVGEYGGLLIVGETKPSFRPLIVFLGLVVVLASLSYVLIFAAANDDDRTGGFAQ
jgi:hypothetical protein